MRFIVLVEDDTYKGYLGEKGLSIYIEFDNKKYLFDFGQSDRYIINGKKLGIDFEQIDYFVLSHGHYDHGNGLMFFKDKKLICHPFVFNKRYRKKDNNYIGLKLNEYQIIDRYKIKTYEKPYFINDNACFLGEIPKELEKSKYYLLNKGNDLFKDDSALVFNTKKGLVIFSGCSHSGIKNIINYSKKVMNNDKVFMLVGGYHLKTVDDYAKDLLVVLRDIDFLYTGHCTSKKVIDYFKNEGLNIHKIHPSFEVEMEV